MPQNQPAAAPHSFLQDLELGYLVDILRRNWRFPAAGLVLGLLAAIAYAMIAPALYSSSARILLDRSVTRYLQANKVIDEPVIEDSDTASQLHILSSESVIVPVVRQLKLARDPEFVGDLATSGSDQGARSSSIFSSLGRLFGGGSSEVPSEDRLERIAVEAFKKRLTIMREDVPSVISVTFASRDAQKAAAIANAMADSYLKATLDAKLKSNKIATQVLQERLSDLKQQAGEAERVLQEFKTSNILAAGNKVTESPEQIQSMSAQLSVARAQMAEAKARLDLVKQNPLGSGSFDQVADNEVIVRLRLQHSDLMAKLVELESKVGINHAAAVKLRQRIEETRNSIIEEQRRIASSYSSSYELAKARSDDITATLTKMTVGASGADGQAKVTLRELEGSADALRRSYNAVLQRLNEISKADEIVSQDARVITTAAPPLFKASRKTMAVLAGSLALGLLLGLGGAFARELALGVIRTPNQLRHVTDAYCAVVPLASTRSGPESSAYRPNGSIYEYVLDAPFSRFTEAFRNVRAMLNARKEPGRGEVVCVVTAVAKEGKTTITSNLGALMASSSRQRVLVIDGDLHRRNLTKELAPHAKEGLIEALDDPTRLSSLVVKRERSGLHVLPCPMTDRMSNAAELLGSPVMEEVLNVARQSYDFIIIEAPPIMSVSDVKMMEHLIDQFVLVVEWGSTRRRLLQEALAEVDGVHERLSCVMLNRVDPAALKTIDGYKGPRFGEYYEG